MGQIKGVMIEFPGNYKGFLESVVDFLISLYADLRMSPWRRYPKPYKRQQWIGQPVLPAKIPGNRAIRADKIQPDVKKLVNT